MILTQLCMQQLASFTVLVAACIRRVNPSAASNFWVAIIPAGIIMTKTATEAKGIKLNTAAVEHILEVRQADFTGK